MTNCWPENKKINRKQKRTLSFYFLYHKKKRIGKLSFSLIPILTNSLKLVDEIYLKYLL